MWVVVVLTYGGIFGWCILFDVRYGSEQRLATWWVARARRWGSWTGLLSFLFSTAALVLYCLLAFGLGSLAAPFDRPLVTLLLTVPAMLLYAPLTFAVIPTEYGSYSSWQEKLRSAGAGKVEQRRIAWWAGPPSILGLGALALTPVVILT
ncbi:MAG: hypothetical protein QM705_15725 [Ancrocorticia sp.]